PEDVLCDRGLGAFLRHYEDGGDVDEDPSAAQQRQDDEPQAEDRGGEVEVSPEPAGDARQDLGVAAALEALDHWCVECVFAHVSSLPSKSRCDHPESPWSDPQ